MALIKSINCRQAVALISDYLDGALTTRNRLRLERHLAACDACSAYLDQMRVTITLTGTVGPEDLSPEALEELCNIFDLYHGESEDDEQ
jgi:anti-sigma factor RsiW